MSKYRHLIVNRLFLSFLLIPLCAVLIQLRTQIANATYPNAGTDTFNPGGTRCTATDVNPPGPGSPTVVGSGYVYKTIKIKYDADYSKVGYLTSITCHLTSTPGGLSGENGTMAKLEWYGLKADQIWWGATIPGVWNNAANQPWASNPPVTPAPDPGPGITASPQPDSLIFQDDAAALYFGSARLACYGIGEHCPTNGPFAAPAGDKDIYGRGWWPGPGQPQPAGVTPYRGAGWFGGSSVNVSGYTTTSANPGSTSGVKLDDVPITVILKNTWQGNHTAEMVFSLRFPQVTDLCLNIAGVQSSVPSGMTRDSAGNCNPTPVSAPCPPPWDDPIRNVSLPNQGMPGAGHPDQNSYTGQTDVISVTDQWGENTTFTDTHNNSVKLDYTPHINNYPYDPHNPVVTYVAHYKTDHYIHHMHPYDCSYTDSLGVFHSQTCYTHEDHYSYTSYHTTSPQTVNAPAMAPCANRTYNVTPTAISAQLRDHVGASNDEEVNEATFTAQFDTSWGINTGSLRGVDPMRVSHNVALPFTIYWYIDRGIGPDTAETAINRNNVLVGSGNRVTSSNQFANPNPEVVTASVGIAGRSAVLQAGDRVCFRLVVPQAGFGGIYNLVGTTPGNINGSITSSSSSRQTPSICTPIVVDKPYFRTYGGDVIAGSNFNVGGSCNPVPASGIRSWNRGSVSSNPLYNNGPSGGAGVQLAAFALNTIDRYVSAAGRGSNPIPLKGLSFANDTGSQYGGGWSSNNVQCAQDYYSLAPQATNTLSSASAHNLNSLATGSYRVNGTFTLVSTVNNINPGQKLAIYVNGDVAINGDIRFVGGHNGIDRIPSVRIISNGNIYIAPNVNQVDAILIAQGGTIYTCSNGGAGLPSNGQMNGTAAPSCRTKLTIYGALVASQVRFLRTLGSTRLSKNSELSTSNNIAETIIYNPELWLALPALLPSEQAPYEAFTSLPPIL